jgi:uncharacterized protein (DUF362 family)
MSLVSFAKIRNDTIKSFKEAIITSLDFIDYSFKEGIKNIVIKPNMCYYWDYTTGETTDPRFVAALIEVLREKLSPKVNIAIVESDASAMKCKYAFKILGYEKVSQECNVNLVNLSNDATETVETRAGGYKLKLQIPQTIQNADLKIDVPKIKYMSIVKLTCALKNIYGCNPYEKKFRFHPFLSEVIVAINKALNFDLCIIDGNIVSGSQPRRLGLVMASRDLVAIDTAATKIAGINPKTIGYLKLAAKEGLGNTNFIQKGIPIDYFKVRYPRKRIKSKLMGKAYTFISTMRLGKKLGLA